MKSTIAPPVADLSNNVPKIAGIEPLNPCVRYGFPQNSDHARQEPILRSIYKTSPEGATTASPVYLLTDEEFKHQSQMDNPYAVNGANNIAVGLQDRCEQENRVFYPIHVESDAYEDGVPFEQIVDWLIEFTEEVLDIPNEKCRFYYSGNRSIHLHIPQLLTDEQSREILKEHATQFCEDTGAVLDTGLYDRKRQFRLPGVIHRKTGFRKVEIEPHWNHGQIINAAQKPTYPTWSYADVIERVFEWQANLPALDTTMGRTVFGNERCLHTFTPQESTVQTPLIERDSVRFWQPEFKLWKAYNWKEFSPYANAGGNKRSVAVVRVLGGAFARKDIRNGTTLIPVYYYGAISCAGTEFTKYRTHSPLQLSKRDYQKWSYEKGDNVVIIGGQSRNSRIFPVDRGEAELVGEKLHLEEGNKGAALAYLENEGYDIGSSGSTTTSQRISHVNRRYERVFPATNPKTPAGKLQQLAEQNGIRTLSHKERFKVANRLLQKYGWKLTWEWFEEQFGSGFKPDVTWKQLHSCVNSFSDLSHVNVPPAPR